MDEVSGIKKTSSVGDPASATTSPSVGNAASNRATAGASASFDAQKTVEDHLCLSKPDSESQGGIGGFLQNLKDGIFGSNDDHKRQECLDAQAKKRAEIQKMMQEDRVRDNQQRDEIIQQMLKRGQQ